MSGTAVAAVDIALPAHVWAALGFTMAASCCRVGATTLVLDADGPEGRVTGWELRGESVGESSVDGVPTRWASSPAPESDAPAHPITASRIDHVVVTTPD